MKSVPVKGCVKLQFPSHWVLYLDVISLDDWQNGDNNNNNIQIKFGLFRGT